MYWRCQIIELQYVVKSFPLTDSIAADPAHDAPELPPQLEPDSQDTDMYQDINEFSSKPNNMADCMHESSAIIRKHMV